MEEDKERVRRLLRAESGADPKFTKMNHVCCKRCGARLYAPMPADPQLRNWGLFSFVVLVIAYIHDRGWRTIKDGEFNGYYCCPDCLTSRDTEFKNPVPSAARAVPAYKEWIAKMREKYNYHEACYDKD